jgi:mevalonate kinase
VGFGSSSALCGAFARAMLAHAGADPMGSGSDRAWELAHAAEKLFHGTPSGIDTGLSLLGGVRALFPQPAGLPSVRPLPGAPLWLVVAGVARDGACGALVGGLSARMRAGDGDVRESVEALGALARRALECLEAPPGSGPAADLAGRLAGLASRAMEHLRRLGLGNPAQDRLLEAGVRAGALGGKLSGAGAGGAFFLIASDRDSARAVAQRLRDEAGSAGIVLSAPARAVYAGRDAGEPES